MAVSSYAISKGVNDALCTVRRITEQAGVFDNNSSVRLVDIRDGSSNTFVAGEAISSSVICFWSGV